MDNPYTGKTLGPYRLLEQIGRGGMATVLKAYQPSMDRYVAIKILPGHFTQDKTFADRFIQEAHVLARLEHPHILPVYDYGEQEGVAYLVMRYVDTGTLHDVLARSAPMDLHEIVRLMEQIGRALGYAHSLGVIHRDVKPSNVLIDDRGNAFLTDFGIAKLVAGTAHLTGEGVAIGTPAYMSPEQVMGKPLDYRSDIYALGVMLYEMVTGHVPFDAETPMAVMLMHVHNPLPLPRQSRPDLPEVIERVILKALAKLPEDRFQSAEELVETLRKAVADVPLDITLPPIPGGPTEVLPQAPAVPPTPILPRRAEELPVAASSERPSRPPVSAKRRSGALRLLLIGGAALAVILVISALIAPGLLRTRKLALLEPADLVYKGAFAYPDGEEWTYSGHALAYAPVGDPAGKNDGYPGSLYAAGHPCERLVGEISIPAPVNADTFADLPRATVLRALTDITEGWKDKCELKEGCHYTEIAGLEYLPNINKIAWNLRNPTNVSGTDQDSLGWSDLDLTHAQGVWHIGARSNEVFHNAKTSDYLFKAPDRFARQYLDGKWLIAGNHRKAGAFGGSQGPTMYALAPWKDGNPPASGQELDALALLYYPAVEGCAEDDFAQCYYPGYRIADEWGGGAWIEANGKTAILIFGRKGLGINCDGIPGEDCPASLCATSSGQHSDPYEPQILFYDPYALADVVAGVKRPWDVAPYAIYRPVEEVFDPDCGLLNAVAYDPERNFIYVTESKATSGGAVIVHVWEVK